METIFLENDIKVFGKIVTSFPAGIGNAFNELIQQTGDKAGQRNYYGISYPDAEGKMIYNAVAEEKYEGEAKQYGYETSIIERGEYLYKTVMQWQQKTNCIKDVFTEIMKDDNADKKKSATEWYKNDDEMLCMIKKFSN